MSIMVIGGGALGLLFAGKLSRAGYPVILMTRTQQQAQLIHQHGIEIDRVQDPASKLRVISMRAPSDPLREAPDWIFLMVKQGHLESNSLFGVMNQVKGQRTKVVCFQNGLGHIERCEHMLEGTVIYAAVTTEGAKRTSPYQVMHTGSGTTSIGIHNGCSNLYSEDEIKLAKMLTSAGLDTVMSNEMKRLIWNKLLINSVINPLSALMRINNGALPSVPRAQFLISQLLTEGIAVAKSVDIDLEYEKVYAQIVEVCERTSANTSSMLADVLAGRQTEVDYINGKIIEWAELSSLETPHHVFVYQLIKGLEMSYRLV